MPSPNLVSNQEDSEHREGIIHDQGMPLDLSLDEEEITAILKDREENARTWWNKELDLDNVREKAERYYLNKPYEDGDLHEHQIDYATLN